MKIKTINISGYRQINNAIINMEDNITIIAGANNSGKTSLVELFNYVFGPLKGKFCCDDLSVCACQKWGEDIFPFVQNAFSSKKPKETTISEIIDPVFSIDDPDKAIMIDPIKIKICIDYQEDTDDIRNFADYIMDFDPSCHSFYFIYEYSIDLDLFIYNLNNEFDKLNNRLLKLNKGKDDDKRIRFIKEMLVSIYANSSKERTYFADKMYENKVEMEVGSFKKLFNYYNVMATRKLDDENYDRSRILSKNMIDIASEDEEWEELVRSLPDQIIQPIEDAGIQEKVRETSLDTLSQTMQSIAKTNGGHTGKIVLDMEVTDTAIQLLLKNVTSAKYQLDECFLKESSQGLGYSNLIYIHLQLEKYKKSIDPLIVNFFVIEEPEAHMHPQMQNVFTKYLFKYYANQTIMQGFITTHSSEVIRAARIKQLRVLRHIDTFECKLYDLNKFYDSISDNKELLEFYDWFYTINFSDIIFADKIIMYEGDTERMFIKTLLRSNEYETLQGQYLSFVQVGGAYAFNYNPIIEFLKIKTIMITDLDYDKDANNISDILSSTTTNSTLNKLYALNMRKENPTIKELYGWKKDGKVILSNGQICLAFQDEKDGYARTLEEAMLSKLFDINAFDEKTKGEWRTLREKYGIIYTIPREGITCNLRDIVLHTSDEKTDFIYSVIIKNLSEKMVPKYIKEALLWLVK